MKLCNEIDTQSRQSFYRWHVENIFKLITQDNFAAHVLIFFPRVLLNLNFAVLAIRRCSRRSFAEKRAPNLSLNQHDLIPWKLSLGSSGKSENRKWQGRVFDVRLYHRTGRLALKPKVEAKSDSRKHGKWENVEEAGSTQQATWFNVVQSDINKNLIELWRAERKSCSIIALASSIKRLSVVGVQNAMNEKPSEQVVGDCDDDAKSTVLFTPRRHVYSYQLELFEWKDEFAIYAENLCHLPGRLLGWRWSEATAARV